MTTITGYPYILVAKRIPLKFVRFFDMKKWNPEKKKREIG